MKVDVKDSIYELVETGKDSITVRCKIDGREEIWTPAKEGEEAVYELVVDEKTYHYDHAKDTAPAPAVVAALKAISSARTAKNADLVDKAAKSLRSVLASLEPLVRAKFEVNAALADRACQIVYVACESDPYAEVGLAELHKADRVIECLAGRVDFPKHLFEASSEVFQAAWKEAQSLIHFQASHLQHGDIVKFQPNSPYFHPGYFRVDLEDALGASSERPWIGDLATDSGWYLDRPDQLVVVISADEFNTDVFHSNEEVDEALEDDQFLGKVAAHTASFSPKAAFVIQMPRDLFRKVQRTLVVSEKHPDETVRSRVKETLAEIDALEDKIGFLSVPDAPNHEATPEEAEGKFEVNCVGEGSEMLWSKKAPNKKAALTLISEAKKTKALHIELIDSENRTWYYDRKTPEDKWGAPVEM